MHLFHRPAIGLDISDRSIEAVFVVKKGGRPTLVSYGRTVLLPGIVADGVVVNRDELARIVRKLLTDQMVPPLPKGIHRVMFALPESQVFSHVFEVPRVADDEELLKTLAIEADRFFPYSHGETISASAALDAGVTTKRVYFTVVPKATLVSYLGLFDAAGLEPAAIEGEAVSIARSICPGGATEPFVLVDIGARVTALSIFDKHGIQFSETIATAGDAFTAAIAEALKIPPDEAEDLKRAQGLTGEMPKAGLAALKAKISALVEDVRQAAGYYSKRSGRPVPRLFLCGGSMLMPGLAEHLSELLKDSKGNTEARIVDPFQCVGIDANLERLGIRQRGVLIATAMGLALRGAGITKFPDFDFLKNAKAGLPAVAVAKAGESVTRTYKSLPHPHRVGIVVAAVLAAAVGIWALAFKTLPAMMRRAPVAPAASVPSPMTKMFHLSIGSEPDTIQAKIITVTQEVTQNFPHDGSITEGKAAGTIRIQNDGGAAQTLIPTTRFLSEGGVLFRLTDRVSVPARRSISVTLTADQPGKTGDVAPGRFTIPGLPKAQQAKVYGISDTAFTGGEVAVGTPFTADELARDTEALIQLAMPSLIQGIRAQSDGLTVLDALMGLPDTTVLSGPTVGEPTGPFDLKAGIGIKALVFDETAIRQSLKGTLRYEVKSVDFENGTAEIVATVLY